MKIVTTLRKAIVTMAGILTIGAALAQDVPHLVNYQGRLADGSGNNVTNGTYEIQLRIWSDPTGGAVVWGRTYQINVQDGYFNVVMGDGGTGIAGATTEDISAAFGATNRYLGLTVTREANGTIVANPQEIVPRQAFLSAPFALRSQSAANADNLGGLSPDGYLKTAGGTVAGNAQVSGNFTVGGTVTITGRTTASDAVVNGTFTVRSGNTDVFKVTPSGVVGGGIVPVGGIIMWSGANVPAGWALCDGQNSTPDLRGRFILASGGGRAVGATGGNEAITLSVDQMPAHAHSVTVGGFQPINDTWKGGGSASPGDSTGRNVNSAATTSSAGGGQAINIMPPYYALAFIMRTQ